MTQQPILDEKMVADTTQWQLCMRLGSHGLHTLLTPPQGSSDSPVSVLHPFEQQGQSRLQEVEEIVYNNPLLLKDFSKIKCIVASSQMCVMPSEFTADGRSEMFASLFPDFAGQELVSPLDPCTEAVLLTGVERQLAGFLRRTFFNIRLWGALAMPVRHFATLASHVAEAAMWVNMRATSLDVVAFSNGKLQLANTFRFESAEDALYYILTCHKTLSPDHLWICGHADHSKALLPRLAQFVPDVTPLIPAVSLSNSGLLETGVPFDLALLALCE